MGQFYPVTVLDIYVFLIWIQLHYYFIYFLFFGAIQVFTNKTKIHSTGQRREQHVKQTVLTTILVKFKDWDMKYFIKVFGNVA